MIFKVIFIAVFLTAVVNSVVLDNHYWKEYNGTVPEDVLIVGEDVLGNAYVGQGFVLNHGLFPGTLRSGVVSIEVQAYTPHTLTKGLKILCAPTENRLRWLTITCPQPTNLHKVLGGINLTPDNAKDQGDLFLARASINGKIVIGNTLSTNCPGQFALDGKYYGINDFDVLVYE